MQLVEKCFVRERMRKNEGQGESVIDIGVQAVIAIFDEVIFQEKFVFGAQLQANKRAAKAATLLSRRGAVGAGGGAMVAMMVGKDGGAGGDGLGGERAAPRALVFSLALSPFRFPPPVDFFLLFFHNH